MRAYQRAIVNGIAARYAVDGIALDGARFANSFGYDPTKIDFATDGPQPRQWNGWRAAAIGDYVRSVRAASDRIKPGLALGVDILPPEFVEVARDAAAFADAVTFVAPTAYDKDWSDAAFRDLLPMLRRDFPDIATLSWFAYGRWTEASFGRLDRLRRG